MFKKVASLAVAMTELLSREKQFHKMNEKLDKLATAGGGEQHNSDEQHHQYHYIAGYTGTKTITSGGKTERYYTYTKTKGQSATMKKRGAGDAGPDAVGDVGTTKGRHTAREVTNRHVRHTKPTPVTGYTGAISTETHTIIRAAERADEEKSTPPTSESRKDAGYSSANSSCQSNPNSTRRSPKAPPTSAHTHSRTSSYRSALPNSTFTVRYRNPKFVESPSLEVLVKDERASIKHQERPDSNTLTESRSRGHGSRIPYGGLTSKQISPEGMIKFLKSKITILEKDHDRLTEEMSKQKELLEKTLERHKKTEQQRDQAFARNNLLQEQLSKADSQHEEEMRRYKERSADFLTQQKELEMATRELKLLTQTNTNLEKRLYRATEELENARHALSVMKTSERELRETLRIEVEGKDKQIKSLKKQRADLLNAYKKQMFLIDNLKRQNICMEQAKMIGFGEKEFTKVLEWNTKG